MWTSSRTTSGSASTIAVSAASTLPASPRISTRPSSSARTPARKRSWSSTITTLGDRRAHRGRSSVSSTSVPRPGAARIAARPPCRSMRPTIDSRTPRRSAGTASGSKPGPRSRTKTCKALAVGLGVERDRSGVPGELGGVHERLARGGDQRARAVVERRVADGDDVDADAVGVLDLLGGGGQRRREAVVRARGVPVLEPGAQLALLAPGQRRDRARVLGLALDQRQRLQHRVVEVRGDLGALLRADARGALGGQAADEAPPERSEDERDGGDHDEHGQREIAEAGQDAVRVQEQQRGADDQRDAEAAAVGALERAASLGRRRRGPRPPPRSAGAGSSVRGPASRQASATPAAASTTGQTIASENHRPSWRRTRSAAERQQGDARGGAPAARGVPAQPAKRRAVVAGRRQHQPEDAVGEDPDAAGRGGGHERGAEQQRIDAEPLRQAGAHAGHEPVLGIAPQRAIGRGCHRLNGDAQRRRCASPPTSR